MNRIQKKTPDIRSTKDIMAKNKENRSKETQENGLKSKERPFDHLESPSVCVFHSDPRVEQSAVGYCSTV